MLINHHHITNQDTIVTIQMGIPHEYKTKCINKLYELGDFNKKQTNVKATMTSYRLWEQAPLFNRLIHNILDIVNLSIPLKDYRFKYIVSNIWGATYKKGDFAIAHNHVPSVLSFVYYLQLPPLSSSLIFPKTNYKPLLNEDTMIIFPSYLEHEVPPHEDNTDRIVIAGNIEWFPIQPPTNHDESWVEYFDDEKNKISI